MTAALEAIYRRARYRVDAPDAAFTLAVDVPSAALLACHRDHRVGCSAFLTAANPGSVPRTAPENEAAQARLCAAIAALGLDSLPGAGVDPDGVWPEEPSHLVLGLAADAAARLAHEFQQAGLLVAGADGVPRLVMLG